MSDSNILDDERRGPGRPRRLHARKPRIPLPNGDELVLREILAADIDIDPRTAQRMGLPTIYIGGAAYHPYKESLTLLASRIKRPKPPASLPRGRPRRAR